MLRRCLNHLSYMNITELSVFYSLSQWFGQMQLFNFISYECHYLLFASIMVEPLINIGPGTIWI